MIHRTRAHHRTGIVLLTLIVVLAVSMVVLGLVVQSITAAHRQSRLRHDDRQCRRLAEAGVERGRLLALSDENYMGETWQVAAEHLRRKRGAAVEIRINGNEPRGVIATAAYPADAPRIRHTVRLNASDAELLAK